jgi:UDP-N-acetylmuramoyl-L-alanyl-D-glutamate--2,6-diaminopimelate ligase
MAQEAFVTLYSGRMMQAFLSHITVAVQGTIPTACQHLTADSRDVRQGSCFVAIPGTKLNGAQFIDDACARGAAVIIAELPAPQSLPASVCFFQVTDAREALSLLAAAMTGYPSEELSVIGVTGTNGKTTTHWMVADLLSQLGKKCGRVGTLGLAGSRTSDRESLTTPDPIVLHSFFRDLIDNGNECVAMEVSSHALDQKRVSSVRFDIGIFSNLTRDHLDYHGTMERYAEAKQQLFKLVGTAAGKKLAIINLDSAWGEQFACIAKAHGCVVHGYARSESVISGTCCNVIDALFRYTITEPAITGTTFICEGVSVPFRSPYIGAYNVENLFSAILAVRSYGFSFEAIAAAVPTMQQVPGRLERVFVEATHTAGPWAYVDYAHTPDALEKALAALKPFAQQKLIAVFGCGGDRDAGKRPLMFDAAASGATDVVVTSDNPRTEDPDAILADILVDGRRATLVEAQRAEAIRKTLAFAKRGDIVLIAGKGHEAYQIIGTEKRYFSDQDEVRKYYQ